MTYWPIGQQLLASWPKGATLTDVTSETSPRRKRLTAEERRAEIVAAAARIAVDDGLERITLRSVAEAIGVRSGLINHYFPEVDALVSEAFESVVSSERGRLFRQDDPDAEQRMLSFLDHTLAPESREIGRLWLNARNVSRYNQTLRHAVTAQERVNNGLLVALIESGVEQGAFSCEQPSRAALLILVLVDALIGYSNEETTESTPLVAELVFATAEKELGLAPGSLSTRSAQLPRLSGADAAADGPADTTADAAAEAPAEAAAERTKDASAEPAPA